LFTSLTFIKFLVLLHFLQQNTFALPHFGQNTETTSKSEKRKNQSSSFSISLFRAFKHSSLVSKNGEITPPPAEDTIKHNKKSILVVLVFPHRYQMLEHNIRKVFRCYICYISEFLLAVGTSKRMDTWHAHTFIISVARRPPVFNGWMNCDITFKYFSRINIPQRFGDYKSSNGAVGEPALNRA